MKKMKTWRHWKFVSDFPNDIRFRLNFRARIWNKSYTKIFEILTLHDLNLDISKYNLNTYFIKRTACPSCLYSCCSEKQPISSISLAMTCLEEELQHSSQWLTALYPVSAHHRTMERHLCAISHHPSHICQLKTSCETATCDTNQPTCSYGQSQTGRKKRRHSLCYLADPLMAYTINSLSRKFPINKITWYNDPTSSQHVEKEQKIIKRPLSTLKQGHLWSNFHKQSGATLLAWIANINNELLKCLQYLQR